MSGRSTRSPAVAVQSDGKVVAAGRGGTGFTVVRLRADGSLDPTFGSGGIVDTPIRDPSTRDEASAIAVLGDGRILVAGTADYSYGPQLDFALARYLPNGALDPSFGSGGIVVTPTAKRRRRQRDGSHAERRNRRCRVRRGRAVQARALSAHGSPRSKFRQCGHRHDADRTLYADARAVWVQADGKVIAGGTTRDRFPAVWDEMAVARYNVDGTLDTSFGVGGKRAFDLLAGHDLGWALVVQPGVGGRDGSSRSGRTRLRRRRARGPRRGHRHRARAASRRRRFDAGYRASSTCAWRQPGRGSRTGHCRVGRIRRVRAPRFRGLVIGQSPRAGRRLARGARVNLVVGRR